MSSPGAITLSCARCLVPGAQAPRCSSCLAAGRDLGRDPGQDPLLPPCHQHLYLYQDGVRVDDQDDADEENDDVHNTQ